MTAELALFDLEAGDVGRHHIAEGAANAWYNQYADLDDGHLPHWRILGEGSFRVGLLHTPTGHVYKVPRMPEFNNAGNAELAYWSMMRMHDEAEPFVPPHTGFTVDLRDGTPALTVVVLSYMGERPRYRLTPGGAVRVPQGLTDGANHAGCADAGAHNVREWHGRWWLIDASGPDESEWGETGFGPRPEDGCAECNPIFEKRDAWTR